MINCPGVPSWFDFITPASKGLTMYFSAVPHHLRSRQLPLPLYKPDDNTYGPFEYRPAASSPSSSCTATHWSSS